MATDLRRENRNNQVNFSYFYKQLLYDGECMHYVGTSKISKLNPKPNLIYPLIRLPQEFNTIIGKTAHIYESWEEGQKAIVLVFDEVESKETENKRTVIQPVIKQNAESDFSARIEVLEEEIRQLRTLIEKEARLTSYIQKKDGLGRIRIGDLRRVKAGVSGLWRGFLIYFGSLLHSC
jgi:hypothetical protein